MTEFDIREEVLHILRESMVLSGAVYRNSDDSEVASIGDVIRVLGPAALGYSKEPKSIGVVMDTVFDAQIRIPPHRAGDSFEILSKEFIRPAISAMAAEMDDEVYFLIQDEGETVGSIREAREYLNARKAYQAPRTLVVPDVSWCPDASQRLGFDTFINTAFGHGVALQRDGIVLVTRKSESGNHHIAPGICFKFVAVEGGFDISILAGLGIFRPDFCCVKK